MLLNLSRSCYLFCDILLFCIERGHLVAYFYHRPCVSIVICLNKYKHFRNLFCNPHKSFHQSLFFQIPSQCSSITAVNNTPLRASSFMEAVAEKINFKNILYPPDKENLEESMLFYANRCVVSWQQNSSPTHTTTHDVSEKLTILINALTPHNWQK